MAQQNPDGNLKEIIKNFYQKSVPVNILAGQKRYDRYGACTPGCFGKSTYCYTNTSENYADHIVETNAEKKYTLILLTMTKEITTRDIEQAYNRIQPYIINTPVEYSYALSKQSNCNIYFKLENFQNSGSFKPRGSLNKILTYIERTGYKPEMIAPTAGGHGVGLSYAANKLQVKANIYMPETADPDRKKIIEQYNASVKLFHNVPDARAAALKEAAENGLVFLSAYNDNAMVEAGGTVGLEVKQQLPDIDCLILGVGGGGLLSGMAIVLKQHNPQLKIIAVQQENNDFLAQWQETNIYPENYKERPSLAEGIGGIVERDCITIPYLKKYVDEYVVVTEQEIKEAVVWALQEHKLYIEPSAAVGVAAIRKTDWQRHKVRNVLTVVTGRNISLLRYKKLLLEEYYTTEEFRSIN